VPHFLPGFNELLKRFTDRLGIPNTLINAGAESMYPEFQQKLRPRP
jgi:hypothetical protein